VNLHREATLFAQSLEVDFSGLVAEALRAYMRASQQTVTAAAIPAPAAVAASQPDEVPIVLGVTAKAFPMRNAPCPCGTGLKYKRCCERITGPAAMNLPIPAGFRRLERLPREKELCPCGSEFYWSVCCEQYAPFVPIAKFLALSPTVADCRCHDQ
jgi:hypothetical protein